MNNVPMKAKVICHLTTLSFNDHSSLGSSVDDSKEHKSCNVTRWRAVSFSHPSNNGMLLDTQDVGSAERLVRTTTRQPLTNGTRTSNQTTRQPNNVLGPDHRLVPTLLSGP